MSAVSQRRTPWPCLWRILLGCNAGNFLIIFIEKWTERARCLSGNPNVSTVAWHEDAPQLNNLRFGLKVLRWMQFQFSHTSHTLNMKVWTLFNWRLPQWYLKNSHFQYSLPKNMWRFPTQTMNLSHCNLKFQQACRAKEQFTNLMLSAEAFLWSRHHFKDFITVMVLLRNPTSQFCWGMVRQSGGKSRSGFTGLLLVYGWLNMKNITTVQYVVGGFFFHYSSGSLVHCCPAEKTIPQERNLMARLLSSAFTTYMYHSPIRLKWLNCNYLWGRTFPLPCFFSPCII